MKSDNIILPREYLSWSQLNQFERSPAEYKRIYICGEEQRTNQAMDFGSLMATALEKGKIKGMPTIPRYEISEKKIEAICGKIPVLGKLDTFRKRDYSFLDHKTGTVKWTQTRANNHGQITFYAMLIYLKFGVIPKNAGIVWIETKREIGEIKLTGKVQTFQVKVTLSDILRFMARVQKVAKEISDMYRKTIKETF